MNDGGEYFLSMQSHTLSFPFATKKYHNMGKLSFNLKESSTSKLANMLANFVGSQICR